MPYCLYFIFGVFPSIVWLLFFLREDVHPESNKMILKVFCCGILAAFLALIFEFGLLGITARLPLSSIIVLLLNVFISVSLVEEFSKYILVKKLAISDPEFDEPIDVMLYMIIAALGFAALENIFVLLNLGLPFKISDTLILSLFRFLGATFLHALCSGMIGFFLALSFCKTKQRLRLIILGFIIAAFLHGLFNFSIMELKGNWQILIPAFVIIGLGISVSLAFQKLKKIASVCKIK